MQTMALSWLILDLTHSPFYLGLEGFANTIPISIFTFLGGVIADRVDRKKLLISTQWVALSLAVVLGVLTHMRMIQVWHIIFVAFLGGLCQAIAWPVYQTVMANVAERQHLSNAIALNSAQFNLARTLGPVIGAIGLKYFGTAGCFYVNAFSFLAVIAALSSIQIPMNRSTSTLPDIGVFAHFREAVVYMVAQKRLFALLVILAMTSILGVPMVTLLPAFARQVLHMDPSGLGALMAAFGAGAVAGGFVVAYMGDFPGKQRFAIRGEGLFVLSMIGFTLSRDPLVCMVFLFLSGFSMVAFASVVNSLIQSTVSDHLRGRVMSFFVFAFGGFMPVGNLLAGTLAQHYGVPHALLGMGIALGVFLVCIYVAKFARLEAV